MQYARKLRKGDKVAIVSLSSGMLGEEFCSHNIEIGVKRLKEYGLEPVFMSNALKGIEYLKEHPEARAKDLKDAFLDDSIAGIICAIEIIMSWIKGENAFYKWTAGVLGEYPISAEQFNTVSNLMAFTAIDDNEIVGFFTMRRPNEFFEELRFGFVIVDSKKRGQGYGKNMLKLGLKYAKEIFGANKVSLGVFENNESAYYCYKAIGFEDVSQDEIEKYTVMGEEWNCLELEMKL